MQINDDFFMALAIKEAWNYQGLTYPNPAVGCVIVKNNAILSIQSHKKAGNPHAEILALQETFAILSKNDEILKITSSLLIHEYLTKNHNNIFKDIILYTTLEPCNHIGKTPSCASLICSLNIKKVCIGIKDPFSKGGIENMQTNNIEIKLDILKEKSYDLLCPFLKFNKDRFVFFKYASSINGSTDGKISDNKSQKLVHKLRSKIDLIVVGGNTVRTDRPTLDSRLVSTKAPDVFIYSKTKDFDKTIPLFNIQNRKVIISDNKDILKDYNFIMIEGVGSLMKSFEKYIDYYLIFIAPFLNNSDNLKIKKNLTFLHTKKLQNDIYIWAK